MQTHQLTANLSYGRWCFFPADNSVLLLIPRGKRGSLTEEAAQLLKLWLSLSGATDDASTIAAERYRMKALPLKHRPWGDRRWRV